MRVESFEGDLLILGTLEVLLTSSRLVSSILLSNSPSLILLILTDSLYSISGLDYTLLKLNDLDDYSSINYYRELDGSCFSDMARGAFFFLGKVFISLRFIQERIMAIEIITTAIIAIIVSIIFSLQLLSSKMSHRLL